MCIFAISVRSYHFIVGPGRRLRVRRRSQTGTTTTTGHQDDGEAQLRTGLRLRSSRVPRTARLPLSSVDPAHLHHLATEIPHPVFLPTVLPRTPLLSRSPLIPRTTLLSRTPILSRTHQLLPRTALLLVSSVLLVSPVLPLAHLQGPVLPVPLLITR